MHEFLVHIGQLVLAHLLATGAHHGYKLALKVGAKAIGKTIAEHV